MAGRPLRSTRSGATFSPWGEPITSDADFEELLQQSLAQQYECTPPMPSTAEPYPPPSPTSAYAASPPALPAMDASSAPAWTPPAPPTLTTATRKQTRSKQKGHANRRQKRTKTKASAAYQPRDGAGDRHIRVAQASPTTLASEKLPIASTGYIGTCGGASTELCRLDELAALGFEIHPWDGSIPTPILDAAGRVIAVLIGRPNDANWDQIHASAAEALESARASCSFPPEDAVHRRGAYAAIARGISYGGGQLRPGNLANSPRNRRVVDALASHQSFVRIAGFASGGFATWAPRLFAYYHDHLRSLLEHDNTIMRNFPNSVWAAATFNLGPSTTCFKHRDALNLAFGWCSITSLGTFDHAKGGHLVLWDIRKAIQFPAGSTILIPSAAITHSNTTIQHGERRYSFTQYSAGGLFRWVDHGFQNETSYEVGLSSERHSQELGERRKQLKAGLTLLSSLAELRAAAATKAAKLAERT